MYCKLCGHGKDHGRHFCKIDDTLNPSHVNQYTKSQYNKFHPGIARKAANSNPSLANRPVTSSAAGPSSQTSAPDPTNRVYTAPPKKVKRELASISDEKTEKLHWARASLDKVPFSRNVSRTVDIQANFLEVNMSSDLDIRKYRIELGAINKKPVIKRELRRTLITKFLHVQRPPHATHWASDYFSHVVSVGKLYKELGDEDHSDYIFEQGRTPRPGKPVEIMETRICFKGSLNKQQLRRLVSTAPTSPSKECQLLTKHPPSNLEHIILEEYQLRQCLFRRSIGQEILSRSLLGRILPSFSEQDMQIDPRYAVYTLCQVFFTSIAPGRRFIALEYQPCHYRILPR